MNEREFFLKTVERHIAAVEAEVKGVRRNKDVEHVHRMRVALRRLKSTLSDFKDVLTVREYEAAVVYVRKLLRALGSARDIDTKLECLRLLYAEDAAAPYRRGIIEIIDELAEDRGETQPKILKTITRMNQKQVFKAVLKLKPNLEDTGITLDEWAKSRVITRLDKLFSLEPFVRRPGCVKELHAMRIAAKNLRYNLENLEELYGRRVRPFAASAMRVQRALGQVHNFDVWLGLIRILKDSSGRDVEFRKAVNFLSKEFSSRRDVAYKDFLLLWDALKKKKAWARLGFFALDRVPTPRSLRRSS